MARAVAQKIAFRLNFTFRLLGFGFHNWRRIIARFHDFISGLNLLFFFFFNNFFFLHFWFCGFIFAPNFAFSHRLHLSFPFFLVGNSPIIVDFSTVSISTFPFFRCFRCRCFTRDLLVLYLFFALFILLLQFLFVFSRTFLARFFGGFPCFFRLFCDERHFLFFGAGGFLFGLFFIFGNFDGFGFREFAVIFALQIRVVHFNQITQRLLSRLIIMLQMLRFAQKQITIINPMTRAVISGNDRRFFNRLIQIRRNGLRIFDRHGRINVKDFVVIIQMLRHEFFVGVTH